MSSWHCTRHSTPSCAAPPTPLPIHSVYINKDYKPFLRHNATITVIQT